MQYQLLFLIFFSFLNIKKCKNCSWLAGCTETGSRPDLAHGLLFVDPYLILFVVCFFLKILFLRGTWVAHLVKRDFGLGHNLGSMRQVPHTGQEFA